MTRSFQPATRPRRPALPRLALAFATAALATSMSAQAQTGGGSLLPGTTNGYVGINVGKPEFDAGCGTGLYRCDDPDVSGYFYAGGMFTDWIGLEVGYLNSGRAERAGGSTRAQGLNVSAVLRAPLGSAFNVFAKGGAIYGQTRVSTGIGSGEAAGTRRGWGASYGVGAGWDLSNRSGVVVEWSRHEFRFPGAGRRDLDNLSVGYVHRF
jgi:hypothetical protein